MTYREIEWVDGHPEPPRAVLDVARRAVTGEVSVRHHAASRARWLDAYAAAAPRPARLGRGWGVVLAAVVALPVLAGGAMVFMSRAVIRPEAPAVAAATATSTASTTPAASVPAADANAGLTIVASPPEAVIYLDDVRLPSNPASILVPRDGNLHRVRIEAFGYLPQTSLVALDQPNVRLQVTLSARKPR